MKLADPSVERFWLLVDKNGPTVNERLGPCWLWTGSRASLRKKYPRYYWQEEKKFITSHRFIYIKLVENVSDEYQIHHECETRLCVRPEHLKALTRAEHLAVHGQGITRTHCKRGHEYTPENTYYVTSKGTRLRRCVLCHRIESRVTSKAYRDRKRLAMSIQEQP
jgi:hypothetical protein